MPLWTGHRCAETRPSRPRSASANTMPLEAAVRKSPCVRWPPRGTPCCHRPPRGGSSWPPPIGSRPATAPGTWPGRSPTARPRCWPASVRACPTRRSRPGCTCPKPGSRATSRGCRASWAPPTAPRPACSPTTPGYRQPVARVGEAAGWNSGWVPGKPGCVLRPDVRARRVRRASRARRESAAVAIMSLTRLVASWCRISGCMGSSWVRRSAAGCRAGRSGCRGTIRRSDRPGGR